MPISILYSLLVVVCVPVLYFILKFLNKITNYFSDMAIMAIYFMKKKEKPKPHPTLRFHTIHGNNIKLKNDDSIACRFQGYSNGIVFSNVPIIPSQKISIKVMEVKKQFKGRLLFGFTSINPCTLDSNELDTYCDIDKIPRKFWMENLHVEELGSNLILNYYYIHSPSLRSGGGEMRFNTMNNGIDDSIQMYDVDTKKSLWAFIHVYGNIGSIMLIDLPKLDHSNQKYKRTTNNNNNNNNNIPTFSNSNQNNRHLHHHVLSPNDRTL